MKWLNALLPGNRDSKLVRVLSGPLQWRRLKGIIQSAHAAGFGEGLDSPLEKVMEVPDKEIVAAVNKLRAQKRCRDELSLNERKEEPSCFDGTSELSDVAFQEYMAHRLVTMETKWRSGVEYALAVARKELLRSRHEWNYTELNTIKRRIMVATFQELQAKLLDTEGPRVNLNVRVRNNCVRCDGTTETDVPFAEVMSISKVLLDTSKATPSAVRLEKLGNFRVHPQETVLAMFPVKRRSLVVISGNTSQTFVKVIDFPRRKRRKAGKPAVSFNKTFDKWLSTCDFDAQELLLAVLFAHTLELYKFTHSFRSMALVKTLDLSARATLQEFPITDVLLMRSLAYITDANGGSQSISVDGQHTSKCVRVCGSEDCERSRLVALSNNLAVGVLGLVTRSEGTFAVHLDCISNADHQRFPRLALPIQLLSASFDVTSVKEQLLILDHPAGQLYVISVEVSTSGSDSYRICQRSGSGTERESKGASRTHPWLWTFYRMFEKFPVLGLLETGKAPRFCLTMISSGIDTATAIYRDYFALLMADLRELKKPLHGLDLAAHIVANPSDDCSMSLQAFIQTLVTFVPIMICRAEYNCLSLMDNGELAEQRFGEDGASSRWEAADIADSIRFGLLSPLLAAWKGRCAVVSSMGKQSTGKSYFLNHLSGSSFAISGDRCTDGVWMTVRGISDGVLLVVLDFEGIGSFERTDQEDVLLSVLNAAVSAFTIFRVEMRMDKDLDGMLASFQKGSNLLKMDERLFQGKLCMSVKDVNPNDKRGVVSEFQHKLQNLLAVNSETNFVSKMYPAGLDINVSPPLITAGYYQSLRQAQAD